MDYGALPPEVNSGRMYVGAGPGPMLAAAAAWDGLAVDLYTTAASYSSLISELTGVWTGPASAAMATASAPYAAWLTATAAQAEQTAFQAKAAVGAYEAAFAMTVPPPVIAANRAQLMMLIATNFFGQNLPAIAATEAHYAEMWAQDAAAMYGYAAASAGAATLTTFDQPPSTTDPGGQAGQAAAVAHAADAAAETSTQPGASSALANSGLATGGAVDGAAGTTGSSASESMKKWTSLYTNHLGMAYSQTGNWEHMMKIWQDVMPAAGSSKGAAAAASLRGVGGTLGGGPLSSGASSTVSAGLGRAGTVGHLSVPQSWAAAAPATSGEIAPSAVTTSVGVGPEAKGGGLLRGIPLTGTGRATGGKIVGQRYGFRQVVVARHVVGG